MTNEEALAALWADKLPTEYVGGEWRAPVDDGAEVWACVTYSEEPSPETGHKGWFWWALGMRGEAQSYEGARGAVVAEIARRLDAEAGNVMWKWKVEAERAGVVVLHLTCNCDRDADDHGPGCNRRPVRLVPPVKEA
jgi:hypothetical protein